MTTQGQGRAADPVGFGIPVTIEGPWAQPRIYPDMAGMLHNPDAAYAKLHEVGKGLFGPNGGLNGILGGIRGLAGGGQTGGSGATSGTGAGGQSDLLGGQLGQTLGNLIQQGLGAQQGSGSEQGAHRRSRSIPPIPQTQAVPPLSPDGSAAQAQGNEQDGPQDSQQMNDVLRQLFNR